MTETRAVAHLPNLDIEIRRRRRPDEDAEQLAISLRARPSFEALARFYGTSVPLWPWLALNPMLDWPAMLRALWSPWLVVPPGSLSQPERPHNP